MKNREFQLKWEMKNGKGKMLIGSDGLGDPWTDLAMMFEAVGTLAAICRNQGITEHRGQPLNEYLHGYLDKVLKDYGKSFQIGTVQ